MERSDKNARHLCDLRALSREIREKLLYVLNKQNKTRFNYTLICPVLVSHMSRLPS